MNKLYAACFGVLMIVGGMSTAEAGLVTYTYAGPTFTLADGPHAGNSISGSFTTEELAASTTTSFTTALPGSLPTFSFTDGTRTINNGNIVLIGNVTGPTEYYVSQFTIRTDASGDIEAWWIQFISSATTNALTTYLNGTGKDETKTPDASTSGWGAGTGEVVTGVGGTIGTWRSAAVGSTSVPAPAALPIFLFGAAMLGLARRRRR